MDEPIDFDKLRQTTRPAGDSDQYRTALRKIVTTYEAGKRGSIAERLANIAREALEGPS